MTAGIKYWRETSSCRKIRWRILLWTISRLKKKNKTGILMKCWVNMQVCVEVHAVMFLLHMALLGLTCCPVRNCCSFLMSTRVWAMSSASLWLALALGEPSSPEGRHTHRHSNTITSTFIKGLTNTFKRSSCVSSVVMRVCRLTPGRVAQLFEVCRDRNQVCLNLQIHFTVQIGLHHLKHKHWSHDQSKSVSSHARPIYLNEEILQ